MILVTGATGNTGGATVRALAAAGAEVRALVRDPQKFQAPSGVEVVVGHFEDPSSLDAALQGVDHAFLVAPYGEQLVQQETAFVQAAQRANLQHLVRASVIGAGEPSEQPLRINTVHRAVERVVRESGIPFTFLRSNNYMQNFLFQAGSIAGQNTFYTAGAPEGRVSHIDTEDVGAVAAKTLMEPGHIGHSYTLTGPEALNDDETAARFSAVLGRTVTHVQVPLEGYGGAMTGMGMPQWMVDGLVELAAWYNRGHAAEATGEVQRLIGRPPRSIDDFIRDHRAAFGG